MGAIRILFSISFLLFVCRCDTKKNTDLNAFLLLKALTPTMGMFGDSIMALWPAEEQLKPFITIKNAFPVRTTSTILGAVIEDKLHYDACIYNGGINDYLSNYSPKESEIRITVDNQLQTIALLRAKCDQILVINTWYVELPWPTEAALKLNVAMKQNITTVPRLDAEDFILKSDLLDGGHLTDKGYNKLAIKTLEEVSK